MIEERDRLAKLISDAGNNNMTSQRHMVSSTDEGLINIGAPTEQYEEPPEIREQRVLFAAKELLSHSHKFKMDKNVVNRRLLNLMVEGEDADALEDDFYKRHVDLA